MPKFKSDTITIKLSPRLKKDLEKYSREKQMSQAEFLRYLLEKYIDNIENLNKND